MSPFKEYDLMCPKCGSNHISGGGARHEGYLWHCEVCGCESWSKTRFKKEKVLEMKRWSVNPFQIRWLKVEFGG